MKNEQVNLVRKLFIPIFILIILTSIISIGSFFFYQKQHFEQISIKSFKSTKKSFEEKFKKDISVYKEFIELISKDKTAVEYFLKRDRLSLYNYYKPTYENWKEKFKLSHFYFHSLDKTNFLRVHNYKKYNDLINRTTLNNSLVLEGLGAGIEFGIAHNLTLRVVYPWFYEGKIIGYIELGKEIDYFTKQLATIYNVDLVFTLKKTQISYEDYTKWINNSKDNTKFKELENFYIIDSTIKTFDSKLQNLLNKKENIINTTIHTDNNRYIVNSENFIDANGDKIGKIFILQDFKKDYQELIYLLLYNILIVLFLSLGLLFFYYKLIRRQENKIESKQNKYINLSITDGLTGINNRRYFDEIVPKFLRSGKRDNEIIAFFIMDIDHFKLYNDTYGHQKGDAVLIEVAQCLKSSFSREDDICFRLGGEEFAAIFKTKSVQNAYELTDKIRHKIEDLKIEHKNNTSSPYLTASFGLVCKKTSHIKDEKALFDEADKLLYKAKESGRNKVTTL